MPNQNSRTYVLLHGAWHGAWCWKKLIPLLNRGRNRVLAPDLPGHGDDPTPIQNIHLKTYVDFVVQLIEAETKPVVLLGHSMSGVVISEVAEIIPQKIQQLVYLSGFVPSNGGSLISLIQEELKSNRPSIGNEVSINEKQNEISLKMSKLIQTYFYQNCEEQDVAYALMHLQKQPFRPFLDKVNISAPFFGEVPKLYIECLQDKTIYLEDQRRMRAKLNCQVVSIDSDHSPFFSKPFELARILLESSYDAKMKSKIDG